MPLLRVDSFSVSLDGFGAGPDQSLDHPMGVGAMALHEWVLDTRTFAAMHGGDGAGGRTGVDDDFAARGSAGVGAWILGRNMFAPSRGPWTDDGWRGWWGENPVYHVPVFVLTHHAREPLVMEGGTTFHFVTGGIREAYDRAMEAAAGRDVRVGGGAATVRQYLEARLVDRMHVAIAPVVLGRGEPLWQGLDLPSLGYAVVERVATERATHVVLARSGA